MYDRHLDTFIMVADLGSFSKAAEQLYISPNAVIKQINLLENDIGIPLFARTNHGVSLTEAGEIIYHDAKRIIDISQKSMTIAKSILRSEPTTIRIGTSQMRPCRPIVNDWITVCKDYPDIQMQIVPFDDGRESWQHILSNLGKEIDVIAGIYPSTLWGNCCQVLKLNDLPLCMAVSRKNPLSDRSVLRYADLAGQDLMIVQRGDSAYIDAVRDEIEREHPDIHIKDVPPYDTKVFNHCDSAGSIMITISYWSEIHPSLVTIPFEWNYTVPYGLIYAKEPSHAVRQLIQVLGGQRH